MIGLKRESVKLMSHQAEWDKNAENVILEFLNLSLGKSAPPRFSFGCELQSGRVAALLVNQVQKMEAP